MKLVRPKIAIDSKENLVRLVDSLTVPIGFQLGYIPAASPAPRDRTGVLPVGVFFGTGRSLVAGISVLTYTYNIIEYNAE
jgi:hypothetical protein